MDHFRNALRNLGECDSNPNLGTVTKRQPGGRGRGAAAADAAGRFG